MIRRISALTDMADSNFFLVSHMGHILEGTSGPLLPETLDYCCFVYSLEFSC